MVDKLQTIMDRILIRLDKFDEQTQGGIILTDEKQAKIAKNIGTVISIGEQVKSVKIGDKVFFHSFSELPSLEDNTVVIRERSLLGIITND